MMELRRSCEGVDWSELGALFAAADLGGRVGDKLRRAFEQSDEVCFGYEGERLVAAARAITDYEYHALIYDVAVHPERQRRGVGTSIMRDLMERLPVWRMMLVCDGGNDGFYEQLGFSSFDNVMARFDRSMLSD